MSVPIQIERGSASWKRMVGLGLVLAIVAMVVPEFFLSFVEQREFSKVIAMTVSLWGLVLMLGPANQLSLGHGAFMAFGAFCTMIFATRYDWPPFAALIPAAVFGFAFGVVVGLPALRVRGQYMAMVTLAVAVAFPQVIQRFAWFTGGSAGPEPISDRPPPDVFSFFSDNVWQHLQICAIAGLCWFCLHNLMNSAPGRALRAATTNEDAAAAVGIPVGRTVVMTYGIGAMLGAIGGGLWSIEVRTISTEEFDVVRSLILYAVVVFGGVSSFTGSFFGAVLFVGASWLITKLGWKESPNVIYAVVLLAVTATFPGGIAEIARRLARRLVTVVEVAPRGVQSSDTESNSKPG